jgi:hypothetical protein
MPSVGDQVAVDGIRLKVLSVNGRRIKKVRITKSATTRASRPPTAAEPSKSILLPISNFQWPIARQVPYPPSATP